MNKQTQDSSNKPIRVSFWGPLERILAILFALVIANMEVLNYFKVDSARLKPIFHYGIPVASVLLLSLLMALGLNYLRTQRAGKADIGHTGGIEVLKDWGEADEIICAAKDSLVIIDSFIDNESGNLQRLVKKATAEEHGRVLKVSIYMASPDKKFGAQRVLEIGPQADCLSEAERRKKLKEMLDQGISKSEEDSYGDTFKRCVESVKKWAPNSRVVIKIYKYPSMVAPRIFVVDATHYVFGWFPLLDQNPGYVCCHFNKDHLSHEEQVLAKSLADQVDIIQSISDQV